MGNELVAQRTHMCHEGCVQQWQIIRMSDYIFNRHEALPEDNNLVAIIIELLQLLRYFLAGKASNRRRW